MIHTDQKIQVLSWGKLIPLAIFAPYFYVFMEWLFYVTKPSFMDLASIWTKLGILLLSGLIGAATGLLLILLLFAISLVPAWAKLWKVFLWVGGIFPAIFIASTALMMIDNFSYTVFKFGIVSTQGIQRGIYGFLFLIILLASFVWVVRGLIKQTRTKRLDSSFKIQLYFCAGLVLLSFILGGSLFLAEPPVDSSAAANTAGNRPNILIIGSDGLDADHMSLYGYAKDTTPFLSSLAQNSLLAENNFPNANITTGSVVSIFTSRLPIDTRVIYPPNILKGADAFQHLPGLLKNLGYYNAEISINYYLDPDVLNLQNSFVMYNGNSTIVGRLYTLLHRYLPEDAGYFLSTIAKRLSDRVFHIYYIRTMPNPYAEVTDNLKLSDMSDMDRLGMVKSLFTDVHQPLFIHAHLMGTHSANSPAYDQEVNDFDGYMRAIITDLAQMGKLDQTILIVYTDHGYNDVSNVRIPLMIRFPKGEHAGKISNNTQNLDIAPTILDYLGIQPPSWMVGTSLLKGEPPANRPIFSVAPSFRAGNEFSHRLELDLSKVKPPFYQFGTIGMVICQKWYALDTSALTWNQGNIDHYPAPCTANTLPDDRQAQQIMIDQLKKDGFDVTTLQAALEK